MRITQKLITLFVVSCLCVMFVSGEVDSSGPTKSVSGAIKCYVCNELEQPSCRDPKEEHAKECTNGETHCRTTTQSVNGVKSVIRQCAKELYKPNYVGCYKTAGKSSQNVCTCIPTGDKPCNQAFLLNSSLTVLVLSALVSLLLKFN